MSWPVAVAVAVAATSLALALLAPWIAFPAWRHPDAEPLATVAPRWTLARLELARIGCVSVVAVALAPLGAWPLAALAALAPTVVLRWRLAALRDRAAARSLDILQATHAALRSGMPLVPALRIALERCDTAASGPFQRALEAFELNAPFDDALREAARESADRRVTVALDALALLAAEQLPAARAASVVASVADRLTFDQRLAEEVRARTGGMRAQIVLLALVVPALALYLVVSMPGLGATLATPLGTRVLLPAALFFEIAGIVASRAIVRGVIR